MTTITRQQIQNEMRDRAIPTTAIAADARIPQNIRDRLAVADLNGDGRIGGRREVDRLFRAADDFDRNGSRHSIAGVVHNAPNPAATALQSAVSHARPVRGLGPPSSTGAPATANPRGEGTAPATSATQPPAGAVNPGGQGLNTNFRRPREVDADRLRAALPPQARHLAQSFIDSGRRHGVDPLVLAAISRHETGGWTSNAFRNRNNAMGISGATGPRTLSSHAASIEQMARGLANPRGYYRNANTIREMWGVYAPGPATGQPQQRNDPRNLNRHWGPGIAQALSDLERAVR